MDRKYQGQPIYIKGFVPPLTVNKLFAGYDFHREAEANAEYTAFVDHVLDVVGVIDPDEPIFSFDVRDGEPTKSSTSTQEVSEKSKHTSSDFSLRIGDPERLKFENELLKRSNMNLSKAMQKQAQENQTFWWAMLALVGIIVLGMLGFGD